MIRVFLTRLAGAILVFLFFTGLAMADDSHWTDWIEQTQVTSHTIEYTAGLGPSVETVQASKLEDGTSICRVVGTHAYEGVWHQGVDWVAYTTLEVE